MAGGLFDDDKTVRLNHNQDQSLAHPEHLPLGLFVRPFARSEHGPTPPIYEERLDREGWRVTQKRKKQVWSFFRGHQEPSPEVREKMHPTLPCKIEMTRWVKEHKEFETYAFARLPGNRFEEPWNNGQADWDHRGRLILLQGGRVLAADASKPKAVEFETLADFNTQEPEAILAPKWARKWP